MSRSRQAVGVLIVALFGLWGCSRAPSADGGSSATAEKLKRVQAELAGQWLGLKIFDGFRPLAVQRKFWEIIPDDRYVANPAKGSRHNRGAAVDLTLIHLSDGRELPMPTPFDDFSERAGRDYPDLPAEVIRNRDLLRRVMEKHGFVALPTEWWHFDDVDWRNYPITDLPGVTANGTGEK